MLGQLPAITDPNVLVGTNNADDAGVYKINDHQAVVLTADFFTPIVDDPYNFGAISAANAMSDVWAMGATPVAALNIAMFPDTPEFRPYMASIMKGGADKMTEAGVPIIGGHTIKDKEPKFGYAVLGLIHPDHIYDNSKARPGDSMILTKKIGTGIISTGVKANRCSKDAEAEATQSMLTLNKRPSEIMRAIGISTATDVTGFGLIGHMHEVLVASRLSAAVRASKAPCLSDAVKLAAQGVIPGGTKANFDSYAPYLNIAPDVTPPMLMLLADAQTSGGLLIFVPNDKRDKLISALEAEGIIAAYIGDTAAETPGEEKRINILN